MVPECVLFWGGGDYKWTNWIQSKHAQSKSQNSQKESPVSVPDGFPIDNFV